MGFIGEKCVSCGEVFTQDDDIVVCPECGSPHHRSCYKALGRCANAEHHGGSFQWEVAAEPEIPPRRSWSALTAETRTPPARSFAAIVGTAWRSRQVPSVSGTAPTQSRSSATPTWDLTRMRIWEEPASRRSLNSSAPTSCSTCPFSSA